MDNLLSGRQLAQAIGVSHQTIYNWTRSGRLASYQCEDGMVRYDLADGIAAKTKTKPAAKREQGIPDPDPTIVGFCYSDAYGNIRVRFKDIMGKVHDAHVSSAEQALPAEDYYAKTVTAITTGVSAHDYLAASGENMAHRVRKFNSFTPSTPDDRSVLDKLAGEAAQYLADKAIPTTGVPNDIGPPPPVAFEFDDEPSATPFT